MNRIRYLLAGVLILLAMMACECGGGGGGSGGDEGDVFFEEPPAVQPTDTRPFPYVEFGPLIVRETPRPPATAKPPTSDGVGSSEHAVSTAGLSMAVSNCQRIRDYGCGFIYGFPEDVTTFSFDDDVYGDDLCVVWIEEGNHEGYTTRANVTSSAGNTSSFGWQSEGGSICRYFQLQNLAPSDYDVSLEYLSQYEEVRFLHLR